MLMVKSRKIADQTDANESNARGCGNKSLRARRKSSEHPVVSFEVNGGGSFSENTYSCGVATCG